MSATTSVTQIRIASLITAPSLVWKHSKWSAGNVAPAGLPAATRIGFRSAVQLNRRTSPSDTSYARLSGWLPYDKLSVDHAAGTNFAYSIEISPRLRKRWPPNHLHSTRCWFITDSSAWLVKRMEMVVQRVCSTSSQRRVAMRGADDAKARDFYAWESAAKDYSGHTSPPEAALPSFALRTQG